MNFSPQTIEYIRANIFKSPKEILEGLLEDSRFQKRIYADDLNGLFGEQPLIPFKMKQAVKNFPITEETALMLAGIDRLLDTAALGERVGWLATDETGISANIRMFAPGVVQAGVLSEEEVSDILALAGGDYYDKTITEDDIQKIVDSMTNETEETELRVALANCYNLVVTAVDAGERNRDVLNAIFAGA